jgi:hypothetical protein
LELQFRANTIQAYGQMMLRITTLLLAATVLPLTGCRDREITAYRAAKDPAPAAQPDGGLPAGHPPIGQSTNPGPVGTLPEGHPPIGRMDALPDSNPPAATAGNALSWTAPAHWQSKPATSFRRGSYNVPGEGGAVADLAITVFPGDTGGLFANVNRWRGQVGLPPVAESELETSVQRLDVNNLHLVLVDLAGSANGQPTRLVGAIVPHDGQTWFFKLIGPDPLVTREKPAFREFLNTLKAP